MTVVPYEWRKSVEIVHRLHVLEGEGKTCDMVIDGSGTGGIYRDSFYKEIGANSHGQAYGTRVRKLVDPAWRIAADRAGPAAGCAIERRWSGW